MYLDVPVVIGKDDNGAYIYEWKRERVYDVHTFPYNALIGVPTCRRGKRTEYLNISSAFDIEDYTIIPEKDEKGNYVEPPTAFMYHWQWCISRDKATKYVCFGTTWEEFMLFVDKVKTHLSLGIGKRLVVYCHFLSHEFQFMKDFINITGMFAKDERKPLKIETSSGIEFRCSYFLSNNSLYKFCESSKLCDHFKLQGQYDYKKLRTPHMAQDKLDLPYDFNDVYGLCQCIDSLLEDDDISTIPLTSTGYVRRDCRKAVQSNKNNIELFKETRLTVETYTLCKQATRGGDTHASRFHAGKILKNIKSADETSAYPWIMVTQPIFPVSKYVYEKIHSEDELDNYNREYATLFKVAIYDIDIKEGCPDVYIPLAKCTKFRNIVNENGRIMSADFIEITVTGIDWEIIKDCYKFKSFSIASFFYAKKGYIYKELIEVVMDYFYKKTTLKKKDHYFYMKSKNKLNACFGMMLTAIDHDIISYDTKTHEWSREKKDISEMLDAFYNSHSSFLPYQWGLYVTAGARFALHALKKHAWKDGAYWDTDSLKYTPGIVDYWIGVINKQRIEIDEKAPTPAYVDFNGERYYLGVFEDDGNYHRFKTLGAKKYAYEDDYGFHITVSGMDKEKGAKQIGSIDNFEITGKPLEDIGRTTAYYNESEIHEITVNGDTFLTASNVAIVDTTYTLGITAEYAGILERI